ncbi:helix-turn-helix transcriptional regulator [Millisia brevis]|uniref:helix-turn-helix transcriptional regulator n=1 Tax=Millisia brevis TaxID=264148 RepID=UPI000829EE33|nr:helix-turn-helix transcriptional regulator [Millisia brevis]
MTDIGRDRIRELLDAVLADGHGSLAEMAAGAYVSPFHFGRQLTRHVGESPVALRRRVMLERAAWQLQRGATVTDAAFAAGYESVDGFARAFGRAFGRPPSAPAPEDRRGHWLPAPNGVHFHGPTVLYVDSGEIFEESAGDVPALLIRHDLDDISALLAVAAEVDEQSYRARRLPGHRLLPWDAPDESLAQILTHLVHDKQPWIASITGEDSPAPPADDPAALLERHRQVAPRWLALTRDIERRRAWHDRVIDAVCDPPESFLLSQIAAHVLTFSIQRRQLARMLLADAGVARTDPRLEPDPILWHRHQSGGIS